MLFTTAEHARSGFLLTLGVALLAWARVGGRLALEAVEILGAKLRVEDVVKRRLERADRPEPGGASDAAAPRRQAATLQKLVGLQGLYGHVRRVEPPGPQRTEILDDLAEKMREAGRAARFDAAEVIAWFHEGDDPLRVIALSLMLANEGYRDFLAVIQTIDAPHSLFEQFHGLCLAEEMLGTLDEVERHVLAGAIGRARRKRRFRRDEALMAVSRSILDALAEPRSKRSPGGAG